MAIKKLSNPVFITAHPRSGTSLLYRTLLKHTSFAPDELCMEETAIFRKALFIELSSSSQKSLEKYMLNKSESYQTFMSSINFEKKWQRFLKTLRIPYIAADEYTAWKFSMNSGIIRKYFSIAQEARGCKRIVEKTPNHLLVYRRMLHAFPEASILVLVRHPVDVYSSYKKRLQEQSTMSWLDISIREFVEQYRDYSQKTERLSDLANAMVVRYEDFVETPKETFQTICEFLNEPFEELPVREGEPSLNIEGVNPNLSKKIQSQTKNWKNYLSYQEAAHIEKELGNVMAAFGYSKRTG